MKKNHYVITAYYDVTTDIFLTTGYLGSFKNGNHSVKFYQENTFTNRADAEKEKTRLKRNYKENSEYSSQSLLTRWEVILLDTKHTKVSVGTDPNTDEVYYHLF